MKTVLLFLFLCPAYLWAQVVKITPEDTERKHSYLLMRDGSVVRGQIIRQDSSLITVKVRGGDFSFIEADQVLRISANRPDEAASPETGSAGPALYSVFVFRDGTQVEGNYVRRDSAMMTVRKRNGQLTYFEPELLIRVDTVRSEAAGSADSRVYSNRFSPWLLNGQTAYVAEKGRFYYRNTLLLLNEFNYGITRNWSVGASFVTPIPYLILTDYYAFNGFLTNNTQLFSKLSVPVGNHFRLALNVTYKNNSFSYYIKRGPLTFQALASVGTSQHNVTVGYGLVSRGSQRVINYASSSPYISYTTDVPIPNQSFLTLGIMQKVTPGLTLLSDNRVNLGDRYYADDTGERTSLSFALRLDRRRHAFDLGVYGLVYRENLTWDGRQVRILPYIGYSLLIGRD
ncbi:hypothetical protein [Spirosoma sp. KNUC1025]|uniref:hypothetical protein n=1 Tax=Spirosoma sp. KNUC1025 TaxID=2894082 RepID=UPI0038674EE7|nr:hypothetical protein LN737_20675 [Spirosoma sp. KNUC1025]